MKIEEQKYDALQGATGTLSHQELNKRMMHALDFNAEDLQANQNGFLSERQKSKLNQSLQKTQKFAPLAALGFIVFFVGLGGYLWLFPPGGQSLRQDPQWILSFIVPLAVFVLLVLGLLLWILTHSKQAWKVGTISGRVKLTAHKADLDDIAQVISDVAGGEQYACTVKIGKEKFLVQESVIRAFQDGDLYRIHYLKQSLPWILSVETLEDQAGRLSGSRVIEESEKISAWPLLGFGVLSTGIAVVFYYYPGEGAGAAQ